MVDRRYAEFLRSIDFQFIFPGSKRDGDGRFRVERKDESTATVLELHNSPLDMINTMLEGRPQLVRALRPLLDIPRMGSFAGAAAINRGVERLGGSGAYVNVGVWNGFSLLCGMEGHPDTPCIGVDNFSQYSDRSTAFMELFEARKGSAHRFHRMDYRDYFASEHEGPIGFYFYDGDHAYEHQVRGLEIAEPFFSDDCVVMVDDTNWGRARQATYDFMAASERPYEVLLDAQTQHNGHPTFWNGLLIFQATGASRHGTKSSPRPGDALEARPETEIPSSPIDFESRSTLVSLVVCEVGEGGEALARTIEAAFAQTWSQVEVVVVDTRSDGSVEETLAPFQDRVTRVVSELSQAPPRSGLDASNGSFVGFIDTVTALDETAVEISLELPDLSTFNGTLGRPFERARSALAAGRQIRSVIPPNASFAIAALDFTIPRSVDSEQAHPLLDPALDEAGLIARLEDLRRRGVGFAAFFSEMFGWLEDRPLLAEHVRRTSRPLVENDDIRIVELAQSA